MRVDRVTATDHELVLAYQRSPESAPGRRAADLLLDRYRRRVLLWCRRLIRDPDLAEDLAHDALLGALRSLSAYDDHGDFASWLFMVTRNRCLSELRRRRLCFVDGRQLERLADAGPRPDQVYERKLLGGSLDRLLRDALEPVERDALWLRCWEGLPVSVITRQLHITESTGARAVLQRARRKLRRAMGEHGERIM
jgi:RNA polymerase sigma-70 factor (ECF subfamily)